MGRGEARVNHTLQQRDQVGRFKLVVVVKIAAPGSLRHLKREVPQTSKAPRPTVVVNIPFHIGPANRSNCSRGWAAGSKEFASHSAIIDYHDKFELYRLLRFERLKGAIEKSDALPCDDD
jgi:hypothetical protein